jgi:hypothetical protein
MSSDAALKTGAVALFCQLRINKPFGFSPYCGIESPHVLLPLNEALKHFLIF